LIRKTPSSKQEFNIGTHESNVLLEVEGDIDRNQALEENLRGMKNVK